jgi:predicted DNA-binding transcriptional regulator AlpA
MKSDSSSLLTPEEVVEMLRLPSRATLYAQPYRGEPPGSLAITVGRHLRWIADDLRTYLEEQKQKRPGPASH